MDTCFNCQRPTSRNVFLLKLNGRRVGRKRLCSDCEDDPKVKTTGIIEDDRTDEEIDEEEGN